MENTLSVFIHRLEQILMGRLLSVHLYGSCVMDDFQPGWSDIDLLCFTDRPITPEQSEKLLMLRQTLVTETGMPLFRAIEGAVVCSDEFEHNTFSRLVYWGTGGQKITNQYVLDPFSSYSLLHYGKCIYGRDMKHLIPSVDFSQMLSAIHQHLLTIRQYAQETNDSLYSCGWLLDIARCLYTLRHQTLISKTNAGKWALAQRLCPEPFQMEQTLAVRQNPSEALKKPEIHSWLKALGPSIQKFADILEKELEEHANEQMV